MRRLKKWLVAVVGLSFLVLGGGLSARADATSALKKAPLGISVNNVFTPGGTPNNQAQVVPATNPETPGTEAVQVTDDVKQFGTIWSTDDNLFDLTKDETVSMWMYFGDNTDKAADGMALVFQNDANGLAATPTFKDGKVIGETIGVWAVDNDTSLAQWVSEVAKKGIRNSWALEFDTHPNVSVNYKGAGGGNAFDGDMKTPHIASNYPGHGDAYTAQKVWNSSFTSSRWLTLMKHLGLIQGANYNMLANDAWHHVTLEWSVANQQMTYTFDDKDPDTGAELTGQSRTVDIDMPKIDPDNTGKIRWGFTGATGDLKADNLVIFEKVPGLVEVDATSTLTDTTTNREVKDGDTIMGKDAIKLAYDLTYSGGKQEWQDVTARLKLPTDLTFETITIDYANGESEEVSVDEIDDGKLNHLLAHGLTPTNPTATITLTGRASDPKEIVEVDMQTSTFSANNGIESADTVAFKINPKVAIDLELTSDQKVSVDAGETTTITALVQILENIGLTNSDLTVHPAVNGEAKATSQVDPADDAVGQTTFTPDVGDLKTGVNTVELYVTDIYGNQSNTVTVELTVRGELLFGTVAKQSSFKDTELTGASQNVKRTDDWGVQILDTRQAGSPWHLQVAATAFTTDSGQQLTGSLVYRDGDSRTTINGSPTTITAGQSSGDKDATDITQAWNDTTGLELTVGGAAAKGSYSADITWTLNDTPA